MNMRIAVTTVLVALWVVSAASANSAPLTALRAGSDGERVTITWSATTDTDTAAADFIVFRSRSPITSTETLAGATQLAVVSGAAGRFLDYPVPGVPAYYALIDIDQIAAGVITFEPGRSVTTEAVSLPLGARTRDPQFFTAFAFRDRPLPLLQPWRDMLEGTGEALPRALPPTPHRALNPAATAALAGLMELRPPEGATPKRPVVLDAEQTAVDKGVAFTLKSIVDGPFTQGAWAESREQLGNLLTLPLPAEIESRARFYLGQTLFYEGRYERAVLEFVLARRHHVAEATPWIRASLQRMGPTTARVQG
ncbi:MAG: hypothetical protein EA403_12740 [Spirochaetaceae bacterium]|nr:MAG: hypothetical protein EA403_12740 [Spirochaetaceae bacterium]